MVVRVIDDEYHSIIDVIHYQKKEDFDRIALPRDEIIKAQKELVKKELKEDYPSYGLVYAAATRDFEDVPGLGKVMRYVARGAKYY